MKYIELGSLSLQKVVNVVIFEIPWGGSSISRRNLVCKAEQNPSRGCKKYCLIRNRALFSCLANGFGLLVVEPLTSLFNLLAIKTKNFMFISNKNKYNVINLCRLEGIWMKRRRFEFRVTSLTINSYRGREGEKRQGMKLKWGEFHFHFGA